MIRAEPLRWKSKIMRWPDRSSVYVVVELRRSLAILLIMAILPMTECEW